MLEKLFAAAERWLKTSSWKDLALVKFCLFAIGVLAGLSVKGQHKKTTAALAAVLFLATYLPLMARFVPLLREKGDGGAQ